MLKKNHGKSHAKLTIDNYLTIDNDLKDYFVNSFNVTYDQYRDNLILDLSSYQDPLTDESSDGSIIDHCWVITTYLN